MTRTRFKIHPAALKLMGAHQRRLRACTRCPNMHRPVVVGAPVVSEVMIVGQAPGPREGALGRPFAWTAGKRLFQWLGDLGLDETAVRSRVYFAAVCRCFPGKLPSGGDRVPAPDEIEACAPWLERELELLEPKLVLPVGRLAIERFLGPRPLVDQVGQRFRARRGGRGFDVIPLPHPSGASTWFQREPGKTLLRRGLGLIAAHPAWRRLQRAPGRRPLPTV